MISSSPKKLLSVLKGNTTTPPPIWFMRQAGRYLPEYRQIRQHMKNFLELCYTTDKAAEVTLQPLRRFDLDAAIIFSDILVLPHAMGQNVSFKENHGPILTPLQSKADIKKLSFDPTFLTPVYQAITLTRKSLLPHQSLLGFAGAPWTLASYMIEGQSSPNFSKALRLVKEQPETLQCLISMLIEAVSDHLCYQIEAGADAVQIFDSWAGLLDKEQIHQWSIIPIQRIIANVKAQYPTTPVIIFPKGVGKMCLDYVRLTGADALSFDHHTASAWVNQHITTPVQGNISPELLAYDLEKTLQEAEKNLLYFRQKPFIFNLGHGILPQTPIEHVKALVNFIKHYDFTM